MLSIRIRKRLGPIVRAPENASGDRTPSEFTLDVEFEAAPGVTVLFGASGSGKTTTLQSIAGLIRPDSGRIAIDGDPLFDSDAGIDIPIRKRRVGYVFQNLALFPHLTARENVEFAMSNSDRRDRARRADEMMRSLHIGHTADRLPRDISGGEAQRVALARALCSAPRMLLLDEPLSAIDEATKLGVIRDLKELNRQLRLPIIYVTHSRDEAIALGSEVIIYERGRVLARGEPLEVFGSPVSMGVARLSGVDNIFNGVVVKKDAKAGTMRVEVRAAEGECNLDVPISTHAPGDRVRIAVRPGDILMATQEPRFTSARNVIRGRIESIHDRSDRTEVRVASGVIWNVSVTRQAVAELGLATGRQVWLAIKTYSCHLLDID
ncbi:MAG TPA: molybdenum ABC transporter ATP-binding protein [Blastocatellia bacterium]|nr:molybdenum ABC transporter ATP-binding protein [Blastocatellia bacterium]